MSIENWRDTAHTNEGTFQLPWDTPFMIFTLFHLFKEHFNEWLLQETARTRISLMNRTVLLMAWAKIMSWRSWACIFKLTVMPPLCSQYKVLHLLLLMSLSHSSLHWEEALGPPCKVVGLLCPWTHCAFPPCLSPSHNKRSKPCSDTSEAEP